MNNARTKMIVKTNNPRYLNIFLTTISHPNSKVEDYINTAIDILMPKVIQDIRCIIPYEIIIYLMML